MSVFLEMLYSLSMVATPVGLPHGGPTMAWVPLPMVIKIPIRILKSYDFTIQHYEKDSNLN